MTSNEAPPTVMLVVYWRSAESSSGEDPERLPRRYNPRLSAGIRRASKLSRKAHEKSPSRTKARSEAGNFENMRRKKEREEGELRGSYIIRGQCHFTLPAPRLRGDGDHDQVSGRNAEPAVRPAFIHKSTGK